MKFTTSQLIELASSTGGSFAVSSLEESFSFCQDIAQSHYENFPVASVLIPSKYRKSIFAVYAFARIADDISDEIPNEEKELKINLLNQYKSNLDLDANHHPIFAAINHLIKEKVISKSYLEDLITAFLRDVDFKQAEDYDELMDYCQYSANPVGRLVLEIFGEFTEEKAALSDDICTALQVINFWQDIEKDLQKKRLYIPKSVLKDYELSSEQFYNLDSQEEEFWINFTKTLYELHNFSEYLLFDGAKLVSKIKNRKLRLEIGITIEAAHRLVQKLRKLNVGVMETNVKLKKYDYFRIIFNTLIFQRVII